MLQKMELLFLTTFLLSTAIAPINTIKVTSVSVPSHQVAGEPVKLKCNYDLEDDTLYSVKWYRGNEEFFTYIPAENQKIKIYDLPGVVVDSAVSDSRTVNLRPVSLKSSGMYKCEVSADMPSFHTESKSENMQVVELPETVPTITGGRTKYHVGDEVHVNCTSARSRPAASLKWYINGEPAVLEQTVQYAPEEDGDELETSRLGLRFRAGPRHFPNDRLTLKCTATIAAVYWQESGMSVEGRMPQTGPALESKAVYSGSAKWSASSLTVSTVALCSSYWLLNLVL